MNVYWKVPHQLLRLEAETAQDRALLADLKIAPLAGAHFEMAPADSCPGAWQPTACEWNTNPDALPGVGWMKHQVQTQRLSARERSIQDAGHQMAKGLGELLAHTAREDDSKPSMPLPGALDPREPARAGLHTADQEGVPHKRVSGRFIVQRLIQRMHAVAVVLRLRKPCVAEEQQPVRAVAAKAHDAQPELLPVWYYSAPVTRGKSALIEHLSSIKAELAKNSGDYRVVSDRKQPTAAG